MCYSFYQQAVDNYAFLESSYDDFFSFICERFYW